MAGCHARHDVESELSGSPRVLSQPRGGGADQSRLLRSVDGELGWTERSRATCLDFHQGDERTTADDEVDLHAVQSDVAVDDAIPSAREKLRGASLPFRTEGAAVIVHVWGISAGPGDGGGA